MDTESTSESFDRQRRTENCLAATVILFVMTIAQIGAIWHNRWWAIPCIATAILALQFWERFLNYESAPMNESDSETKESHNM